MRNPEPTAVVWSKQCAEVDCQQEGFYLATDLNSRPFFLLVHTMMHLSYYTKS